MIARPALTDALAETKRRSYGPGDTTYFLDGAALALHDRPILAGCWNEATAEGHRWAKARLRACRPTVLDAIVGLYRRVAA